MRNPFVQQGQQHQKAAEIATKKLVGNFEKIVRKKKVRTVLIFIKDVLICNEGAVGIWLFGLAGCPPFGSSSVGVPGEGDEAAEVAPEGAGEGAGEGEGEESIGDTAAGGSSFS